MISDLSQRIEIKSIGLGQDFGFGAPSTTEASLITTWASIKQVNRESAVRQGLDAETVHYKVTIRYAAGRTVDKDYVVLWNGVRYSPTTSATIIEIDKKKFMQFLMVSQNG